VIQDRDDPYRFYFYEVYRDVAALAAHRESPHFKYYAEKTKDWLAAPAERRFGKNLIPNDAAWR
jgi:autoinducer 2-degrading protein